MYDTMLIMQPIMYIYPQEGMHVSQNTINMEKTWGFYYVSWYIFMYVKMPVLIHELDASNKCLM